MATFTYTKIADFILDDLFGFASANSLKNSVRYIAEDILGDPASNSDLITAAVANSFRDQATRANGVTPGQGGVAISTGSGSFTTTSLSLVDVTNLTVTLVTTGRPVLLALIPDGASLSSLKLSDGSDDSIGCTIRFFRDVSTQVAVFQYEIVAELNSGGTGDLILEVPAGSCMSVDTVAAGSYVYKVQAEISAGGTIGFFDLALLAYEL